MEVRVSLVRTHVSAECIQLGFRQDPHLNLSKVSTYASIAAFKPEIVISAGTAGESRG